MSELLNYLEYTLLIGLGATAVMDIAAVVRKRLRGVIPADYGLVGRWYCCQPHAESRRRAASQSDHYPCEHLVLRNGAIRS
jgi:hypothetical protein